MANRDDDHPTARVVRAEVKVPASPEQVWQAIATEAGNAAWLFPAEIEAREGGAIVIHREPYGSNAVARVTAWGPPHRFAYEEPVPAADGSTAPTPLATEFLVEARSGGTCVVRVVSGFLRDGEGWEDVVEGAGEGWRMALTVLRSYLAHFAGQPAAGLDAIARIGRPLDDLAEFSASVMAALGLTGLKVGDAFQAPDDAPPLAGVVEHTSRDFVILRASEPCPALFEISTFPMDGVTVSVNLCARLYGPDRAAVAQREQPRWNAWLADRFPAMATRSS